jgi:hypothetical protein
MWNPFQSLISSPKSNHLTINSYGQETCSIPSEQIRDVMKWLGLSLMAAGYQATAHIIIWDSQEAVVNLDTVMKNSLRRHEPTFLYRYGDRPMQPPYGYYWRLMPEYPTLRMYQLELKEM